MPQEFIGRYDPKAVRIIIQDTFDITGLAADITVRRADPMSREWRIGTTGDQLLVEHVDKSVMVEFALLINSPAIIRLKELDNARTIFPVSIISRQTMKEIGSGQYGIINRPAQPTHGTSPRATERDWAIGVAHWVNDTRSE